MTKFEWMRIANEPRLKELHKKLKDRNDDIWYARPEQDHYAMGQWAPGRWASDEVRAEFENLCNELLKEKLDEADGEKDGKFSVHNLDSEDGSHDDRIDVSRLADAIQRGPGHVSEYDEDGNKIED